MPVSGSFQATCSAEIAMTADPPQDHLNKHALINLNKHFLDDPATRIGFQE